MIRRVLAILLALCAISVLAGCSNEVSSRQPISSPSSQNEYERNTPQPTSSPSGQNENEWNTLELSLYQELGEITYYVPENWRNAKATSPDGMYYYPYDKSSDGLLYISYQPLPVLNSIDISDAEVSNSFFTSVLDGMNDGNSISNMGDKQYTEICGFPAVVVNFVQNINGVSYGCLSYMFFSTTALYSVIAAEPSTIGDNFVKFMPLFIERFAVDEKSGPTSLEAPAAVPSMTTGQKNALGSAKSYLRYSAFSYEGLIKQLEYEKYSNEDAVYAADNCGADWNEQALKSAQSYLQYSAFSYKGLIEQLKYEGFTNEQATYGADKCGADWNEQAAKSAKSYLNYSTFSRDSLIDQLEYEGFTHEQAVYGVEANGF